MQCPTPALPSQGLALRRRHRKRIRSGRPTSFTALPLASSAEQVATSAGTPRQRVTVDRCLRWPLTILAADGALDRLLFGRVDQPVDQPVDHRSVAAALTLPGPPDSPWLCLLSAILAVCCWDLDFQLFLYLECVSSVSCWQVGKLSCKEDSGTINPYSRSTLSPGIYCA
jgi:hypothetical protein